jgi:hypothetical protein
MFRSMSVLAACGALGIGAAGIRAQTTERPQQEDPIRTLVGHLDLERYKETIRGLTPFGDRRQGRRWRIRLRPWRASSAA